MKLGYVSAIFPDLQIDDLIGIAKENQLACIELMCWPVGKAERKFAGVTHIDVTKLKKAEASEIKDKFENAGIEISGLGFYPNILSDDREYAKGCIDHLKRVMDAAKLLGIRHVNTFVGAEHSKSREANFERFEKTWPKIVKEAEKLDLLLGIENCPMYFTSDEWPSGKNLATSPRNWRQMFDIIPSPHFGLNYDPSHLVWQMMDPIQPIKDFKDRIHHVHAKDARVDRQKLDQVGIMATPLEYHRPVLPGLGDIDWGAFIAALGEIGYTGPVCIEVEDDAYSGSLQNRLRALRISQKFLAPYFG